MKQKKVGYRGTVRTKNGKPYPTNGLVYHKSSVFATLREAMAWVDGVCDIDPELEEHKIEEVTI